MKKLIKLLLILIFPSLTQACLWLEGTTIDGNYKTFEDRRISSIFLEMSQYKTAQQNFQDKFYRESNQTIEYMALYQIMNGEYKQAIKKLLEIEKESPNLYSTASNLGTAYELQGNSFGDKVDKKGNQTRCTLSWWHRVATSSDFRDKI